MGSEPLALEGVVVVAAHGEELEGGAQGPLQPDGRAPTMLDCRGVSQSVLVRVPAQLARRATVFCLYPTREEGDWTLFISELIDRTRV